MRVFLALLSINLKDLASFRFDAFTKLAGYPIQFGLLLVLWHRLAASGIDIDLTYLSSYYAISFVILAQYPFLRMAMEIQGIVMRGNYVKNMVSGVSLPSEFLAEYCVRALWFNLFSIPCAVALTHTVTDLQFSLVGFIGLFVTIFLGGLIQMLMWMLIGMTAFWIVVNTGLTVAFQHIQRLLTGAIIPLSMLPSAYENILFYSPFPYSLFVPVDTYLTDRSVFPWLMVRQVGWILALGASVIMVYRQGLKRTTGAMV